MTRLSQPVNMSLLRLTPSSRSMTQPISIRQFSTQTSKFSNRVPPQSPAYIRLPTPPQYAEKARQRVRGFLPVPREVFPRHDGDRKTQRDYLDKTAPEPAQRLKILSKEQRWRDRMARSRRQNLRQGLNSLWSRKSENDRLLNARDKARSESHRTAAEAPEREDDRLTRGTVLESLMDTKVHLDPGRFARADRSRSQVLASDNAKREARRDALMELYISASNFITSESELKKEIETVFSADYFKKQGRAAIRWSAANAWGIYGKPPSVPGLLDSNKGSSTKLVDVLESEYDRSVKRQKRIAEEFTGGKM